MRWIAIDLKLQAKASADLRLVLNGEILDRTNELRKANERGCKIHRVRLIAFCESAV
jgi:hypothetical protein